MRLAEISAALQQEAHRLGVNDIRVSVVDETIHIVADMVGEATMWEQDAATVLSRLQVISDRSHDPEGEFWEALQIMP